MLALISVKWIGIVISILIILCFYFTLTFFESLRNGDTRIIKQSKIAAVVCLTITLVLPMAYSLIIT